MAAKIAKKPRDIAVAQRLAARLEIDAQRAFDSPVGADAGFVRQEKIQEMIQAQTKAKAKLSTRCWAKKMKISCTGRNTLSSKTV